MSNFIEGAETTPEVDLDNAIQDDSFLDAAAKEAGYDENATPGARGALPPEGPYHFRFEFPAIKDGDESKRWSQKVAKKGDPYIGTSIKATLQRTVAKSPVTLEEFDAMNLANRQLSMYLSSLFMFGRSSMTDFINCVSDVKFSPDRSIREARDTINELMQQLPEGTATIKWVPFFKNGEDKWERLADLLEKVKKDSGKKYKGGAKNFPKDDETGLPLTGWTHYLSGDENDPNAEKVDVIVMPELDLLLPHEEVAE